MKETINSKVAILSYNYSLYARSSFMILLSILLVSFAAYMYFVVSSLSSGVAYQQVRKEIASTEYRIANLEGERIARMKAVDLSFAKERGFIEVSPTRYIARASGVSKITMRNAR